MSQPVTKRDWNIVRGQFRKKKAVKAPELNPGDKVRDQNGVQHTVGRITGSRILFLDGTTADGAVWAENEWRIM